MTAGEFGSSVAGVSIGARGLLKTGLLGLPPERRAAMRRDRNLSAKCFGTSAALIKLIEAPWFAVYEKVARLERED